VTIPEVSAEIIVSHFALKMETEIVSETSEIHIPKEEHPH
jgi:hypothetical protein